MQEVAVETGLHPNTVRFHLERLEDDGLVSRRVQRSGGPGRPPLAYTANPVPDAGRSRRDFEQLAEVLAQLVARTSRDPTAPAIEAGRSWGLSRSRASEETTDEADAIAELTAILSELGFAPDARTDADADVDVDAEHTVILQRHCPFLEVAELHQDVVCSLHLGLIRGILENLNAPVDAEHLIPFATPEGCEARLTTAGGDAQPP